MTNTVKTFLVVVVAVALVGLAFHYRTPQSGTICSMEAMLCPDGSSVSRTGPNCEFTVCPTSSTVDTSVWKTVTDPTSGISFRYPADFGTTYISVTDWPPKVALVNAPFSCTEAGTETAQAGATRKISIGGHEYCVTKESEGAAGSIYTQYAYAGPKEGKTMIFTFSLRFVQCANYDNPKKTECETERGAFDPNPIVDAMFGTATLPNTIASAGSGIQGNVLLGPTCPVMRNPPDPNCADRPYAVALQAKNLATNKIVASFSSNANGIFTVSLPVGKYSIEPAKSATMLPRCSESGPIVVATGVYASTTIYCDSGIR